MKFEFHQAQRLQFIKTQIIKKQETRHTNDMTYSKNLEMNLDSHRDVSNKFKTMMIASVISVTE